ncbi:uncharacterized protein LOC105190685 [Harpegnathos saltator]|uniref:Uncharacterized protein n=1 Tax=Harpegnathos saltator TaxID=610380 RepID=E2B6G5_HARSA|nr:uncharacterized protein LOC105190685 [Harpegnathos saltator]XP_025161542.1 uncharacterized protein LOC105190685 [Harpegnathos saltator]EFN88709.1 hypothetical protein EAI_03273 [Harpegnathos saltator]
MKLLLIAASILVAIEARAYQNWGNFFNNPGFGNGRGGNNGRNPFWAVPLQQDYLQSIAMGSDVEWVCRNSKTNDMMIIATSNTQQSPAREPWQWQNIPPGHQRHRQDGSYWTRPIIIVQDTARGNNGEIEDNQTPLPNTSPGTNNNNNNNQPTTTMTTTPQYHGGEGQIDIRFGKDSS